MVSGSDHIGGIQRQPTQTQIARKVHYSVSPKAGCFAAPGLEQDQLPVDYGRQTGAFQPASKALPRQTIFQTYKVALKHSVALTHCAIPAARLL